MTGRLPHRGETVEVWMAEPLRRPSGWPLVVAIALAAAVVTIILLTDDQRVLGAVFAVGVVLSAITARWGGFTVLDASAATHPWLLRAVTAAATLSMIFVLRESDFSLLTLATVLIYATVCIGLTIQMGYAGLTNFAAAAFVGSGGYAAATIGRSASAPDLLVLIAGGLAAVVIGFLLVLPVLRTRGHYAGLTTLAFGVLFNVFLDANEMLGGPQGLKLAGINLFGWDFSNDLHIAGFTFSFYANYVILTAALAALAMAAAGLVERSWIGIWFDAVRLDETAAQVFGLNVGWWKTLAFTLGNFIAGVMGAVYAKMTGFIAPNNFTFSDSLLMVSIVILGGLGNRFGVLPAAFVIVVLPEKLQIVQEYRLLIFALLVILILLVRPNGLVGRGMRRLALQDRP